MQISFFFPYILSLPSPPSLSHSLSLTHTHTRARTATIFPIPSLQISHLKQWYWFRHADYCLWLWILDQFVCLLPFEHFAFAVVHVGNRRAVFPSYETVACLCVPSLISCVPLAPKSLRRHNIAHAHKDRSSSVYVYDLIYEETWEKVMPEIDWVSDVVSVGRGKYQQHETMAAVIGPQGIRDQQLLQHVQLSSYSTSREEGKQSRGTWQCEAKDSEEKRKLKVNDERIF